MSHWTIEAGRCCIWRTWLLGLPLIVSFHVRYGGRVSPLQAYGGRSHQDTRTHTWNTTHHWRRRLQWPPSRRASYWVKLPLSLEDGGDNRHLTDSAPVYRIFPNTRKLLNNISKTKRLFFGGTWTVAGWHHHHTAFNLVVAATLLACHKELWE